MHYEAVQMTVDCLLVKKPEAQRALKERDSVFDMHKPESSPCYTNVDTKKNDARCETPLSMDSNFSRSSSEKKSSQLKKRNL